MRGRVIGAAKTAAGVAAGLSGVVLLSAVMVGVFLTAEELDGRIDDE